jgi:MoaA/NifB/PqqE/SkfB family radical SAM enzyme
MVAGDRTGDTRDMPARRMIERLSIELSNRCRKACWFCYSASGPAGETRWTADDLVALVRDGAANGVGAVSFGGGEPLEAPELLFPALAALRGLVFRSFTTSGLDLDAVFDHVVDAAPDKIHVSIHHPGAGAEVERVIAQVTRLAAAGIASGVNLLVMRSQLAAAGAAGAAVRAAGIDNTRIVYLPMRGRTGETPTPAELATSPIPPEDAASSR